MSDRSSVHVAAMLKVAAVFTLFAKWCFAHKQLPPSESKVESSTEPARMDLRSPEAFRLRRQQSAICAGVSLNRSRKEAGPVKPRISGQRVCRHGLVIFNEYRQEKVGDPMKMTTQGKEYATWVKAKAQWLYKTR